MASVNPFNPLPLNGTNFDDWLYGANFANLYGFALTAMPINMISNTIFGNNGNDIIYSGVGVNTINAGAGNDTIYLQSQVITGLTGNMGQSNTVDAGAGNDIINGSSLGDVINGGDGNDIIRGNDGDDYIKTGLGADKMSGGVGIDTVDYSDNTATVSINMEALYANSAGGSAATTTAYGDIFMDYFHNATTGSGNDIIQGNYLDNLLISGAGNDKVWGRDGNDTIILGEGDDVAYGGNGNDFISSTGGKNFIAGYDGNDILMGGIGNDTLLGENGDDVLGGGLGNNNLYGGFGNDTYILGAGNDFLKDDGGIDTIVYKPSSVYQSTIIDLNTSNSYFYSQELITGEIDGEFFGDWEVTHNAHNSFIGSFENVDTNATASVYGNSSDNILKATGVAMTSHMISCKLDGRDGNDTLIGGRGSDEFWGGAGTDKFRFEDKNEYTYPDKILDFEVGIDKIDVSAMASIHASSSLVSAETPFSEVENTYFVEELYVVVHTTGGTLTTSDFIFAS